MPDHTTWFQYLPGYQRIVEYLSDPSLHMKRRWEWLLFTGDYPLVLDHVFAALLILILLVIGGLIVRAKLTSSEGVVPDKTMTLRTVFEMFIEAVLGLLSPVLGEKKARYFLPLIGSLAFFIFTSNLLGLLPGFLPPTDTLKTNLGLALVVFLVTHVYGIKEHGAGGYLAHFMGPIRKWYALPLMLLMFLIEVISHLARPVSLSIRLLGNIAADHKVVSAFFLLVPLIIPLPFMLLGVLVAIVQTLVFCLLSTIYISLATAHEEH
jgi:F-type H+-transporting ATPase subunit a